MRCRVSKTRPFYIKAHHSIENIVAFKKKHCLPDIQQVWLASIASQEVLRVEKLGNINQSSCVIGHTMLYVKCSAKAYHGLYYRNLIDLALHNADHFIRKGTQLERVCFSSFSSVVSLDGLYH